MSGAHFPVPSVVSDSIVERENCILFTQRLQYATFPLYSLQLPTDGTCTEPQTCKDTQGACSAECIQFCHGLRLPAPCYFFFFLPFFSYPQQFSDIPPWHVIKKCHRFWGNDFCHAPAPNGEEETRRGNKGMTNWSWTKHIKSGRQEACCVFYVLHMGRKFELDWKLNHITALWASWPHAEAQTIGNQIKMQVLRRWYFTPRLFSATPRPFRSVLDTFYETSPTVRFLPEGRLTPPVPRFGNQRGGSFRQAGKLLLHLTNSPVLLANRVWDWKNPVNWTEWG